MRVGGWVNALLLHGPPGSLPSCAPTPALSPPLSPHRYGYSYGCSAADVWHTVHHTAMLYPGYEAAGAAAAGGACGVCCCGGCGPVRAYDGSGAAGRAGPLQAHRMPAAAPVAVVAPHPRHPCRIHVCLSAEPPKVLHYGLLWQVPGTPYSFDKHWHYQFNPLACPPWDVGCAALGGAGVPGGACSPPAAAPKGPTPHPAHRPLCSSALPPACASTPPSRPAPPSPAARTRNRATRACLHTRPLPAPSPPPAAN